LRVVTYDKSKRAKNLRKHKIDLALCESVFDYPMVTTEDTRDEYAEQRLTSYGCLDGRVVMLVWTDRQSGPHVISCRYGEKDEARKYFSQAYGHGGY
jgi:uncharacterized DUF497 family protein